MSDLRHEIARRLPLWVRMGGRRLFYSGSAEHCEMCGARVRKFLPNGYDHIDILKRRDVVGGLRRQNDRCPVCHSQDRTRLKRFFLERETKIGREPVSVLHVAPDLGLFLWMKDLPGVDYLGTDLDNARYHHIPDFRAADLTDTPFETDRFDIVICSHVLEHIPDDAAAMAELFRITKPGGVTLALTPLAIDGGATDEDPSITDTAERERRFGQWDHVRLYGREDFAARLGRAGFDVTLYDAYGVDPDAAAAHRINPKELLPVCRKPVAS